MTKFIYVTVFLLSICLTTEAAKNPHGKITFDCQDCHTVESFSEVSFDHDKTGYHLEGRHNSPNCKGCHDIKQFNKVTKECTSCHLDVHQQKLGADCEQCHTVNGWEKFDIHEIHFNTEFPLAGKHAMLDCMSCHKGLPTGDMSFNTTRCVECHQSDYLSVSSPDHAGAGFSTDCQSCHQMERWRPALFDNHDMFFPIFSGTHDKRWDNCSACHTVPNNYQQFSCLECHEHRQTEMDNTHNGIIGYAYNSPDCYFCHPTGEAGDFLEHDAQFFPIFTGRHHNTWDDCAACHVNPANRQEFSCLTCHAHNQTDTDIIHGTMTGYSYERTACYDCHPTGEAGDFLAHDAEFFPVYSGSHANSWDDCSACHTNPANRAEFSCLTCHEHNQIDMDNTHNGITGYSYTSNDCYFCHPTGETGDFVEHDAEFFPIFSGTHSNQWTDCSACHTNPTTRTEYTCLPCHEHEQTLMDNMHGAMAGYSYTSPQCLSCHPVGDKGTFLSHDAEFFPIFSGAHNNRWDDCTICHDVSNTRTSFSCLNCHEHNQTDMDAHHLGEIDGYVYASNACYSCHADGQSGD